MKELNMNVTSVNTNLHNRINESMKELDTNVTIVSVKLHGSVT